ncbi:hypothetical protein DDP54_07705 [Cellulomonas sp. WB94]|uniref:hypothetical protein n=1 Tax=Cellulomonas sp. WB94 TaxID=2173174 RepID=UPI000D575192|nr:hypothetical protein [Cellulomonas sp. WB94]PVU82906.1 hypothetical protein DDP54_07705 [Cellulomonas sp. WB94]
MARKISRPEPTLPAGCLQLIAIETLVRPSDEVTSDLCFSDLPDDAGHMSEPIFPCVLRGLRMTPPGYVLDVLAGSDFTAPMPDSVQGITVFDLRSPLAT